MILTLQDFVKMEEIEHQYFPNENITTANEAYNWYLADPNSCIVVKNKNEVIASINILSLKEDVFNLLKYNKLNESEIKVEDLQLENTKYMNYLYFSSISVDKNFRNIQTLKKLIDATKTHIKKLSCFNIVEVVADCSTPQGEKLATRFLKLKPFIKTDHGSVIHILDGKQFINNLKV